MNKIARIGLLIAASVIAFSSNAGEAKNISSQGIAGPSSNNYHDDDKYDNQKKTKRLQVINGTGDGNYKKGKQITIKATRRNGKEFLRWRVMRGSPQIRNLKKRSTTLRMPNHSVSIKAVYKDSYNDNDDCGYWNDDCNDGGYDDDYNDDCGYWGDDCNNDDDYGNGNSDWDDWFRYCNRYPTPSSCKDIIIIGRP